VHNVTSTVKTDYLVSHTYHPVGPLAFGHVQYPGFNNFVDIVSVGLLIESIYEQKVERKMSSGRCRVAVVLHSVEEWRVTFHHEEAVVNELILLFINIMTVTCTNNIITIRREFTEYILYVGII